MSGEDMCRARTCLARTSMFVPAASATTSNLSGNSATISSVCVPIDPVLPRRENLCDETIRGQFASQRGTLHKTNRYPEPVAVPLGWSWPQSLEARPVEARQEAPPDERPLSPRQSWTVMADSPAWPCQMSRFVGASFTNERVSAPGERSTRARLASHSPHMRDSRSQESRSVRG